MAKELKKRDQAQSQDDVLKLSFTSLIKAASLIENINEDISREKIFNKIALESLALARRAILSNGNSFLPPVNFIAETIKTQEHMIKISKLQEEVQNSLKASADAKRQRLLKKAAKEVQKKKMDEHVQRNKDELKNIKSVSIKEDPLSNNDDKKVAKKIMLKKNQKNLKDKGTKRIHKDKKFGFGGKKRGLKRNTKESVNDDSSFNSKKNRALPKALVRKPGLKGRN